MIARCVVGLAALVAAAGPALAEIRVDQSEVTGGALVVTGQVYPPSAVTLGVGISAIQLKTDPDGRFVWIGNQVPPSCTVTVSNGYEQARAGVGRCGGVLAFAPPAPVDYGASGSTSSWRTEGPAPGIGTVSQTTTTTTVASTAPPAPPAAAGAWSETASTTTTRTTRRPLIISPNDPRYAQTEPDHWGMAEVQGEKSGEVLYTPPPRGFYANVRSREGN
jgi:hypothetical protein